MIKITIEMVPHGVKERSRVIASGTIALQAENMSRTRGDYRYNLSKQSNTKSKIWHTWANGFIKNFPRSQRNVWYLIYTVLKEQYDD